jgi:hypothetical protein
MASEKCISWDQEIYVVETYDGCPILFWNADCTLAKVILVDPLGLRADVRPSPISKRKLGNRISL